MKKLIIGILSMGILNYGNAQCPQASFTSTAPACQSTLVDFTNTSPGATAANGYSFFWDFDYPNQGGASPSFSTNENPTGIDYSPGGNGVYTVALTITKGGCSSTFLMDIDIRRARADFSTSANTACVGEAVTIYNQGTPGSSPSTTITHSWSFGAGSTPSTSNLADPPVVTYSSSGAKTITHYVEVNYGGCGGTRSDMFTQTVVINDRPMVNFSSTAPVCEGSSVDFTYTGTTSSSDMYSWDFGVGAQPAMSSAKNPAGVMYSSAGTKNVSLSVTNQFGCFHDTILPVVINTTPVADFATTAPVCTGLGADFTNMGTTGASYAWSFGNGASPASSTTENPSGVVYSSAGTKVVTLTTTLGACSSVSTQSLTIHQTPSVSFTSNAPQCVGSSVNLTNTGSTGSNWSYVWGLGDGAVPASSNAENPTGVMYNSGGVKVITLTIADQFCTSTNTGNITINALPAVAAGADTTICANTSVQIGGSNIAGVSYSWTPSNSVVIDNPSISNPTVSPVAGSSQFIVTGVDGNNCMNTDTIVVTMLPPLNVNAGIDAEICRYDSVQIGASLVEGQLYAWSPQNGLTSPSSPNTMVSPDSTTTYTLSVTDQYGCSTVTDEVTVIVNQLPLANAGPDDSITVNHSVQLVATGGIEYSWLPEQGLSNAGINNPIASPDSTTTYVVSVIDVNACEQTDTVTVVVITPSFWAPSAFSPDGDMLNDVFYIRGDGIDNFEFTVFDQYGHLIFRSKSLSYGWDGSYATTGEKLPNGAYVYHVSGVLSDGTLVNETGMVNLIR